MGRRGWKWGGNFLDMVGYLQQYDEYNMNMMSYDVCPRNWGLLEIQPFMSFHVSSIHISREETWPPHVSAVVAIAGEAAVARHGFQLGEIDL